MNRKEIIEELHQIREKHHEEEKTLSPSQKIIKRRKEVDAAINKLGLKVKRYAKV